MKAANSDTDKASTTTMTTTTMTTNVMRSSWPRLVHQLMRLLVVTLGLTVIGLISHSLVLYRRSRSLVLPDLDNGGFQPVWPAMTPTSGLSLEPCCLLLAGATIGMVASLLGLFAWAFTAVSSRLSLNTPSATSIISFSTSVVLVALWIAGVALYHTYNRATGPSQKTSLGYAACNHGNFAGDGSVGYDTICAEQV